MRTGNNDITTFLGLKKGIDVGDQQIGIERFKERIVRLYEQGADPVRIGQYVSKWIKWVRAGNLKINPLDDLGRFFSSVYTLLVEPPGFIALLRIIV